MRTSNQKVQEFTQLPRRAGVVMPESTKEVFMKGVKNRIMDIKKGDIKPEPQYGGMNVNRFLVDVISAK